MPKEMLKNGDVMNLKKDADEIQKTIQGLKEGMKDKTKNVFV